MKGLRKYLTPFAPDQSGAVSVLYELGATSSSPSWWMRQEK